MMFPKKFNKKFSLVELLIVISVLAILLSLLSPSLKKAMQQSQQIKCQSNQHQIFVVLNFYTEDFNGYLPHLPAEELTYQNWERWPRNVCRAGYLPYLDNNHLADQPQGIFKCPSANDSHQMEMSLTPDGYIGGNGSNATNKEGGDYGMNKYIIGGKNFPIRYASLSIPESTYFMSDVNHMRLHIYKDGQRGVGFFHGEKVTSGYAPYSSESRANMMYFGGAVRSMEPFEFIQSKTNSIEWYGSLELYNAMIH